MQQEGELSKVEVELICLWRMKLSDNGIVYQYEHYFSLSTCSSLSTIICGSIEDRQA